MARMIMEQFPEDIYTEPSNLDVDTLRNLGPLTAMAVGKAAADAKEFELVATKGDASYGICSTPFLEYAFDTVEYRIKVAINPDGTWSYDEDTVLMIRGRAEPFHHTDRNTLTRIGEPIPNPLAR